MKWNDREIIQTTRDGETIQMHRCSNCWNIYRFPLKNGHPIAFDNGYVVITHKYVHADWCRSKNQF